MKLQNKRVVLFVAALLASSLALAATPAPANPAETGHSATTVDCSKDKNGKKATAAEMKKCEQKEQKAKGAGKY